LQQKAYFYALLVVQFMCWSLEVSVLFAAYEAVAFCFVLMRSFRSKDKNVRDQFYILFGIVLSVIIVEVSEALLWMNRDEIVPIAEAIHATCSSRNANITRVLYIVTGTQPATITWMMHMISDKAVRERLKAPTIAIALCFIGWMLKLYIGEVYEYGLTSIENSNFKGLAHTQTCTYLGTHGHLHWTFKVASIEVLPNFWAFFLMYLWPLLVGVDSVHFVPHIIGVVILPLLSAVYTEGSYEAASIWCWTGFFTCTMLILHPFIFEPNLIADPEKKVV
jgi:hypothetical protein